MVANAIKGEVPVTVDGKVWVLTVDFNALCAFEGATGKPALDFIGAFETGGIPSCSDMRTFMHCLMLKRNPDATVEDAGDLLSTDPEAIQRAIESAFPKAGETESAPGESQAAAG